MSEESGEVYSQFVVDKIYRKEKGTACYAPYLDVRLSSLIGRHDDNDSVIRARIDTGADVSCVPESSVKHLMPILKGRPVSVRGHDGRVKRQSTYLVCVGLIGHPDEDQIYWTRPEHGVLLTASDIALIGTDILYAFDMTMKGQERTFSLIRH